MQVITDLARNFKLGNYGENLGTLFFCINRYNYTIITTLVYLYIYIYIYILLFLKKFNL